MQTIATLNDDWRDRWIRALQLGVPPQIQTFEQYAQELLMGRINAYVDLNQQQIMAPNLELLKDVHRTMYMDVHPQIAGQFRTERVMGTTDPDLILRDLKLLDETFHADIKPPMNEYRMAEAIGHYHAGFILIRPFLEGWEEVGRLIMECQMDIGFGYEKRPEIDPVRYRQAHNAYNNGGEHKPMVDLVYALHKEGEPMKEPDFGEGLLSRAHKIRF